MAIRISGTNVIDDSRNLTNVVTGNVSSNMIVNGNLAFDNINSTRFWEPAANILAAFTSNTERLRIDPSGNVSIGTSTTNMRLRVEVPTGPTATPGVRFNNTTNGYVDLHNSLSTTAFNGITVAGDKGIIFTNGTIDTGNFIIAPWATVTAGLRITSDGRVGINNASPTSNLHVTGTSNLNGSVTITGLLTSNGTLTLTPVNGTNEGGEVVLQGAGAYPDWTVDSYQNQLRHFTSNTGASLVTFFQTGGGGTVNVGIGQSSAAYPLDVSGDANATRHLNVGVPLGHELLANLSATGVATQTPSGLTLTGYRFLVLDVNGISHSDGASNRRFTLNGVTLTGARGATALFYGIVVVLLVSGFSGISNVETAGNSNYLNITNLNLTNANTSFTVGWDGAGNFDAGSIRVFGVR